MFRDINSFISNFLKTRSQKGMATAASTPPVPTPMSPLKGAGKGGVGSKPAKVGITPLPSGIARPQAPSVQPFIPREFKAGEPIGGEFRQLAQQAYDSLPKNDEDIAPCFLGETADRYSDCLPGIEGKEQREL